MELLNSLLFMLNEMSPYILLGFLIAGVIYLVSIITGAIAFGLSIDYLLPAEWFRIGHTRPCRTRPRVQPVPVRMLGYSCHTACNNIYQRNELFALPGGSD